MTQRPNVPDRIEAERIYLRPYRAGDGPWFYAMGQRNRAHLLRYESDNVVMEAQSPAEAESLVRDLAAEWAAQRHLFLGAFDRRTDEFVAQVYVGPVDGDAPEFEIGFFADVNHEGRGYVTEAVRAVLHVLFGHLGARRIQLHCDDTNVRSRRVAERCGFVLEEHVPDDKRNRDGTTSGTLCFGLQHTGQVPQVGADQATGVSG
ncbi:MAG TPA: GNAT family N-acetyltransferase [Anaerolineae bacterium]|nr:GNAT family N-acetyltransferase [Anaerolineae bacterium]